MEQPNGWEEDMEVVVLVGLVILVFFIAPKIFQFLWNTTVPEVSD